MSADERNRTRTRGGFVNAEDAMDLLLQYSEWLDPEYMEASGDKRTHEELVRDFLASRDIRAVPYLESTDHSGRT